MTFEEWWAKYNGDAMPSGPEYLHANAAWIAAKTECIKACEEVDKHYVAFKSSASECIKAIKEKT